MRIVRGMELSDLNYVQSLLDRRLHSQVNQGKKMQQQLTIGGVRLPHYLENLGIFAVGSPGSGKTQAIASLIATIRKRKDFRLVVFDRGGEFTQKFFGRKKRFTV